MPGSVPSQEGRGPSSPSKINLADSVTGSGLGARSGEIPPGTEIDVGAGNASGGSSVGGGSGLEPLSPPAVSPQLIRNAAVLQGVPPPQGTVVLQPNQIVRIFSNYAVFDVDETQIEGTGEHVHDGPSGRFALALSQILAAREGATIPPTQSRFDATTWQLYRACTGRSEPEVCKAMVDIANVAFFSDRRHLFITANELMDASHKVLADGWQSFITKIKPIPGVHDLLLKFRGNSVKLGICSASSEKFVLRAMADLGLLDHFDTNATVTGATKKITDGCFDGSPVERTIQALGGQPSQAVMLGDSLSDYAAAALAGVPLIILRPVKDEGASTLTSLLQQVRAWQSGQGETVLKSGTKPNLVVVREFSQVEIGGRLPPHDDVSRFQVYSPTSD
jgi:phosphoglycolate phosphatase-like HAD superfamily hydrolase